MKLSLIVIYVNDDVSSAHQRTYVGFAHTQYFSANKSGSNLLQ